MKLFVEGTPWKGSVDETTQGMRLDQFLVHSAALSPSPWTRAQVQRWIERGHVILFPSRSPSPALKVREGDIIQVHIPAPVESVLSPQNIPLSVVYEDDSLLVINKQAGLVVHPAPGHGDDTLVNALLFRCGDQLSGIGGTKRPGIVHRLDKETSGLMVVAKTDQAHQGLSQQFLTRTLRRVYQTFVWGKPTPPSGCLQTIIGRDPCHRQKMAVLSPSNGSSSRGRMAVTHYQTLRSFAYSGNRWISWVECRLETGRTHQIRVHMNHLQCPIVGDPVYGRAPAASRELEYTIPNRQFLHAVQLTFEHPVTHKIFEFYSDLPEDMSAFQQHLMAFTSHRIT